MRKLTLIALLALTLTGCENTTASAQPEQRVRDNHPQNHPCMSRIYFDGHYYITYDNGGRVSSPSIVHEPTMSRISVYKPISRFKRLMLRWCFGLKFEKR